MMGGAATAADTAKILATEDDKKIAAFFHKGLEVQGLPRLLQYVAARSQWR
jgi:hypothetical protein